MLVLSRRENQEVRFPNLDITVRVNRICGNSIRLGIDAPPEVSVLRGELTDSSTLPGADALESIIPPHRLRNHLNKVNLALELFRRQVEAGLPTDAEQSFQRAMAELQSLDFEIGTSGSSEVAEQQCTPSRSVLVVDDDEYERELLASLLQMHGYKVFTARDGLAALDWLSSSSVRPDAVLLDMCMPRLNGPKTVTSIRHERALEGVKVFAVSGADRNEVDVDTGPKGVDRWFAKPLNAEQLVSELEKEMASAA